jgi:hypothetical protein
LNIHPTISFMSCIVSYDCSPGFSYPIMLCIPYIIPAIGDPLLCSSA